MILLRAWTWGEFGALFIFLWTHIYVLGCNLILLTLTTYSSKLLLMHRMKVINISWCPP